MIPFCLSLNHPLRIFRKKILSWIARIAWPAARLSAPRGYFGARPPAWTTAQDELKVAVVACHWLGDTLWAAAAVDYLRRQWPRANLVVYTKPFTRPIWKGVVPETAIRDAAAIASDRQREKVSWTAMRRLASEAARQSFDAVLDMTGNRYSALFTFWARPRWAVGFGGDEWSWLYSRRIRWPADDHQAKRPWAVLEAFFAREDGWGERAFAREGVRPPAPDACFAEAAARLGLAANQPLGVLAPGAGWEAKRWPPSCFAKVAGLLNTPALGRLGNSWQWVVTGAPSEEALCRETERCLLQEGVLAQDIRLAIRDWPLGGVFALLSECSAFLGNDSGLGHAAAAYGRPTAVVFTHATEPGRYAPIGPNARCFRGGRDPNEAINRAIPEQIAEFFDLSVKGHRV